MNWLALPFYTWVKQPKSYVFKLHNTVVDMQRRLCKSDEFIQITQLFTDAKDVVGYEVAFLGKPAAWVINELLFATYATPVLMKLDVLYNDTAFRVLSCGGCEFICAIRKKGDSNEQCN